MAVADVITNSKIKLFCPFEPTKSVASQTGQVEFMQPPNF